jgi:transcriptional regulator with XRE-family HTH domain
MNLDDEHQAVSARLRAARASSGLTIDALAEATQIKRRTLVNYLNGSTRIPLSAALRLARVTGVTLDWLAAGDERRGRRSS